MSFVAKLASGQGHLVFLVTGKFNDNDAWWYVQVAPMKFPLFKKDINNSTINLTEYGRILYLGRGKEPPEIIKKKITEEFSS